MNLRKRISSLARLGALIPGLTNHSAVERAYRANNWFTPGESARALDAWSALLTTDNLNRWTSAYKIPDGMPVKNIRVITAGNIPLVGFHDFLCVVISGNRFIGKLSSRDEQLLTLLADELISIDPGFSDLIHFQSFNTEPDAVIATGSNNTSRYFKSEYGSIPHIIRKNRNSAAILDGSETAVELERLATDILAYYGLGCRSISHICLPDGYKPDNLIDAIAGFDRIDRCEPHLDNLRYQKARLTMLGTPYTDAGNALLVESDLLHSPIGVVHYHFYNDLTVQIDELSMEANDIQCITGHVPLAGIIPFGMAQEPMLWDYADNIDTLSFLINL